MEKHYEDMTYEELYAIYTNLREASESGKRAESLVPYARYLQKKIGEKEVSLRETLDMAKKEFYEEVAERFFDGNSIDK